MTKRQKFFSALGRFFKDLFTKNIKLKVVALLFAILLWGYVLAVENPAYVKRVRDVEITITGEDSLNNRGLMLVSRDTGTTDVDVLCQISKHSELDKSRVSCSVDLSTLNVVFDEGEDVKTVSVEVQSKITSDYGTLQGLTVPSVELNVARIASRSNIRVTVNAEGELADGFEYQLPENLTVSLRGQKSEVDRIAYADVTVDLSELAVNDPEKLAGTYDLVLPVQFYDRANVRINDVVTVSGDSVTTNVRVVVRAYKDVPIVPNIVTDEVFNENYTYTCLPTTETVRLYGSLSVLNAIDQVATEKIEPKEPVDERRTVSLILPPKTELSETQSKSVVVYLHVTERMSDGVVYEIPIQYSETKKQFVLSGDEPKMAKLFVIGSVNAMKTFDPGRIKVSVDVRNYGEGTHTLPVILEYSGDTSVYTVTLIDESVMVTLQPVEVEPTEG